MKRRWDILRRVDKVARAAGSRVLVSAGLSGVYELILVAATDGTLAANLVHAAGASLHQRAGRATMANASAAQAAAAVVLAMTGSWATLTVKLARRVGENGIPYGAGESECRRGAGAAHSRWCWALAGGRAVAV